MDVLIVEGEGEGAEERGQRVGDRMFEERLDLRLIQPEMTEPFMKVDDQSLRFRVVFDQRRLPRQLERVFERQPAGLADELREEAGEAGDGVGGQARGVYLEGSTLYPERGWRVDGSEGSRARCRELVE